MRGLILTRTGHSYVVDEKPDYSTDGKFIVGELAIGGQVSVPLDNLEAVEWYADWTQTFRNRLEELRSQGRYPA